MNRIQKLIERYGYAGLIRMIPKYLAGHLAHAKPAAIRSQYRDAKFDRTYGTDTSRIVPLSALDVDLERAGDVNGYQPTSFVRLTELLDSIEFPVDNHTFIDFGSGKGRTLLVSSNYPFREIFGIELSKKMHDIALLNIAAYRNSSQRCNSVYSLNVDATKYVAPDAPSVYFLYNPFGGELIRQVAINLAKNNKSHLQDSWLIYENPVHRDVFDNSSDWQEIRTMGDGVIYRGVRSA